MKKLFVWLSLLCIILFNSSCTTVDNIQETFNATKIESINTAAINNNIKLKSNNHDLNGDGINDQIQLEFLFEYE